MRAYRIEDMEVTFEPFPVRKMPAVKSDGSRSAAAKARTKARKRARSVKGAV